jgi:hypothetical protein
MAAYKNRINSTTNRDRMLEKIAIERGDKDAQSVLDQIFIRFFLKVMNFFLVRNVVVDVEKK